MAQSQLLFSIATFQNNTQEPVIYDVSSVYSWVMTGTTTATNDDDMSFRCSPRRGDCRGGDEILMVIPRIDKRRGDYTMNSNHLKVSFNRRYFLVDKTILEQVIYDSCLRLFIRYCVH